MTVHAIFYMISYTILNSTSYTISYTIQMRYCINYSITQYRIQYHIRYRIRSYSKKIFCLAKAANFLCFKVSAPFCLASCTPSLSGEHSPIAPHPDVDLKKPAVCPAVWPGIGSRACWNCMTQRMRNSVMKAQYTI